MKTMLICGANGFIGKNLITYFKGRYKIKAVDIKIPDKVDSDVEWLQADLRRGEDVKKAVDGADIILHYAATTTGAADILSRPYIHVTDNVIMTSLLLREAYEQSVEHFVMPSCTIMYQSSKHPVKEEDFQSSAIPKEYYGAGHTKVYLEKMCSFFSEFRRTKYTVLRQANIYGPHDKFDLKKGHVFAASIIKVENSNDKVVVWGNGEEERDLLYVEDLVECIDSVLREQKSYYELVNVGTAKAISITHLVKSIIHGAHKNLSIEYDETKPTIKTKLAVDISRAKKIFGWEPRTSLQVGIQKTLKWYRGQIKEGNE